MTTTALPANSAEPIESVATLDRYAAWELLGRVTDNAPVTVDVDGSPLTISVTHTRTVEPSMGAHPFGVLLLPVGVESNQAQVLVSGTLTVTYGTAHRAFSWEPGDVSDARWDVAEFIEALVDES